MGVLIKGPSFYPLSVDVLSLGPKPSLRIWEGLRFRVYLLRRAMGHLFCTETLNPKLP